MRQRRWMANTIAISATRIGRTGAPPTAEPTPDASVRNGVRSATIETIALSSALPMPPTFTSTSVTKRASRIDAATSAT